MGSMKKVHHVVRRPGNRLGDPDIEIPVAEDLLTEPGAPVREGDVSFYSREDPLEAHFVENSADPGVAVVAVHGVVHAMAYRPREARHAARGGGGGVGGHPAGWGA